MKLYYATGACSLASRIIAEEEGIALDYERVDLKTHKTETGRDFYEVSPKGYVPVLEEDGHILTENAAILEFLSDRVDRKGPKTGDPFAVYRLNEWIAYINTEIHKTFSPLFGPLSDEARKQTVHKVTQRFAFVNAALAGKNYLLGEDWSAADAYLFVTLTWAQHMKIDLAEWPNLTAFFRRFAARPKVQTAMKAEGLI